MDILVPTGLAALATLTFGYQLGAPDAALPFLRACTSARATNPFELTSCFQVDPDSIEWGVAVGVVCLGALAGSLLFGPVADRFGRKMAILLVNVPFVIGLLASAMAVNLFMFTIGRAIIGVGIGGCCVAVPLYLSELASLENRALIGSFHQLAIVIGYVIVQLVGFGGRVPWRAVYWINFLICLVQLVLFYSIAPESPKFKYSTNNTQAMDLDQPNQRLSFNELIANPLARKSLICACSLHLCQQLSGVNAVFMYAGAMFPDNPFMPLAISGLNLVMTVVSILLVDRDGLGRRGLVIGSAWGCLIGLVLAGFYPSMGILLFIVSFAVGMGPVPWLMIGELFPSESVAVAVSLAVSVNWLSNFIVTSGFPVLSSYLGGYKYVPFIFFLAMFLVYATWNVPETKGRQADYI